MKMIKAMKKLKFWSTKNKNKNKSKNDYYRAQYQHYYQPPYHPPPSPPRPPPPRPLPPPPPPPPPGGGAACQCHFCHEVEPSAPPLPPWLESQLGTSTSSTHDGTWDAGWADDPFLGPAEQEGDDDQCITIPWLESQLGTSTSSTHDGIWDAGWADDPFLGPAEQEGDDDQCITISEKVVVNTRQEKCPEEVVELPVASSESYQQYMAVNPVYELPLLPRREKAADKGLFGCVITLGSLLIRCFCPCFHISQHA